LKLLRCADMSSFCLETLCAFGRGLAGEKDCVGDRCVSFPTAANCGCTSRDVANESPFPGRSLLPRPLSGGPTLARRFFLPCPPAHEPGRESLQIAARHRFLMEKTIRGEYKTSATCCPNLSGAPGPEPEAASSGTKPPPGICYVTDRGQDRTRRRVIRVDRPSF